MRPQIDFKEGKNIWVTLYARLFFLFILLSWIFLVAPVVLGNMLGVSFSPEFISLSIVCGWVAQKVILSILIAPGSKGNAGNFRLCNFETKY